MEFHCKTEYNRKTLAAMSRVLRKTIRAKLSRKIRMATLFTVVVCGLSACLSWGKVWQFVGEILLIVLLLLVNWKEDAINGFFASRKALPGAEFASTTFLPDCYEVQISGAVTRWQYEKVLVLAEDKQYLFFVLGKNHAQAFDKEKLEGGAVDALRSFLMDRTGKEIQQIVG